jgi:hypothetical protein
MISEDLAAFGLAEWWPFPAYGLPDLSVERHPRGAEIRDLLIACPRVPGVYAVRYEEAFGRFSGDSDIVYVGYASDLHRPLSEHLGLTPGRYTSGEARGAGHLIADSQLRGTEAEEIFQHLFRDLPGPSGRFGVVPSGLLEIAWAETSGDADARTLEGQILSRYEAEHWELPPFNRRAGRQ